jgi:hypothetical protein
MQRREPILKKAKELEAKDQGMSIFFFDRVAIYRLYVEQGNTRQRQVCPVV